MPIRSNETVGSLIPTHEHLNFSALNRFAETLDEGVYYIYFNNKRLCFFEDYQSNKTTSDDHINNTTIHVTQEDKNLWNSILNTAKEYARSLFESIHSFEIRKVNNLPSGSEIKLNTIYMVRRKEALEQDLYDEYMYIDGAWEIIGSIAIDFDRVLGDYLKTADFNTEIAKYYTSQQVDQIFQGYYNKLEIENALETIWETINGIHQHSNLSVLNKFDEDENNRPTYNGEHIICEFENGDVTTLISYLWPDLVLTSFVTADGKCITTKDGYIFDVKNGGAA